VSFHQDSDGISLFVLLVRLWTQTLRKEGVATHIWIIVRVGFAQLGAASGDIPVIHFLIGGLSCPLAFFISEAVTLITACTS